MGKDYYLLLAMFLFFGLCTGVLGYSYGVDAGVAQNGACANTSNLEDALLMFKTQELFPDKNADVANMAEVLHAARRIISNRYLGLINELEDMEKDNYNHRFYM